MAESFFQSIIRFRWLIIVLVLGCTVIRVYSADYLRAATCVAA